MSLEVGQLLDNKYRIVRLIGEGGMGAVFEGENVRINRRVAIKVLHAAFTGNAEVMQRFEREAQAAGRIGNDHILEVLDLGVLPDGDRYIIMEYLDGEPLSNRIKSRGRLTPFELAPLIRQTLVGLGAAHAAGIVHRDLKPDNIFIQREKAGQSDYVKIIDFGISKFQPLSGDGMKMTRTGAVMGTPYYMSPEQASGSSEADARSDVYSLGVIMYEAVTGRVPFDAGTFNQLMFKIVLEEVPPPESVVPDLDRAFASIISKSMARDIGHRFQSTADVLRAIDAWLNSGRAVTLPPVADAASAGHLPPGARASMASLTDGVGTNTAHKTAQGWASSRPGSNERAGSKPTRRGLWLAAAASFILVTAACAAYLLRQHPAAVATSAAVPPLARVAAVEPQAAQVAEAHADAVEPSVAAPSPAVSAPPVPSSGSSATRARPSAPRTVPSRSTTKPRTRVKHPSPDFGY